jgi:hypothetical protein
VSARAQELAALAQVPQVLVLPAERPLAPVLAARLQALVPGPEQAQALAPEEASEQASALVLEPGPELRPSVALALARGPRPCAHT